ncbi:MAG: hypothetical protein IJ444_05350 [Kiritimatiellae bacterium]|nr:hypothetical protein [Kiritimatiellia bacterium]
MEKLELFNKIINILHINNIEVTILHGNHNGNIGRDVDVWIKKTDWGKTKKPIKLISEKLNFLLSIVNSPFGLRYLFFKENDTQCGFFELHIVSYLNWFYLPPPKLSSSFSTHKRFTMPLLAKNIVKIYEELNTNPLTNEDINNLYIHLNTERKILNKIEFETFLNFIKNNKILDAHIFLKQKIIQNTYKHPFSFLRYLFRKVQTFFWMFFAPCGIIVLALGDYNYKDFTTNISSKKGVLTKLSYMDFRKKKKLSLLFSCIKRRQMQGRQRATIIHVQPKQLWIKSFFIKPLIIYFPDDVLTKKMNSTLFEITK